MNIEAIGHEVMRISVLMDILYQIVNESNTKSTLERAYVLTEVIKDITHRLDADIQNFNMNTAMKA